MSILFRRIQPLSFTIPVDLVAQLLGISSSVIVRVEKWAYVLFVHRRDRGGQFISYRKLEMWIQAIIHLILLCSNLQELQQIGLAIRQECRKFNYSPFIIQDLRSIWRQKRDNILHEKENLVFV